MRADLFAAEVGVSWKTLVRASNRTSVSLASGVATNLSAGNETTLSADLLSKESVGRPRTKRKN